MWNTEKAKVTRQGQMMDREQALLLCGDARSLPGEDDEMIEANDIKEYINAAIQTEEKATQVNHDTSDRKNENGFLHDLTVLFTTSAPTPRSASA